MSATKHNVAQTVLDNSSISNEPKATERELRKKERSAKNLVDLHFSYLEIISFSYKNRAYPYYLEMCIEYCKKDIDMYPRFIEKYIKQEQNMVATFGTHHKENSINEISMPFIPSFERLAVIYEKQENFEEAIKLCELA